MSIDTPFPNLFYNTKYFIMQRKFTNFLWCLFLLILGNQSMAQDVVIQEIPYNPAAGVTKKIALKNVSGIAQDVSNWCICNRPDYEVIGNVAQFSVLAGDPTDLQPGEVLILELTAGSGLRMNAGEGEIGLYHTNGCGGWGTAANMEDFVRWGPTGAGGSTRETVAVNADLWIGGDIVPPAAVGEILIFDGSSDGAGGESISSDFTNSPNGILPVTLLDFTVTQMEDRVQLKWVTAEEFNSECFKVERSFDGMRYEQIVRVEAAGTTNETTYYQYEDMEVFANRTVYYRLKQMDFDGSLFCSSVEVINLQAPPKVPISISPNPISSAECLAITLGSTEERVYENMRIVLFDAMGKAIKTYPATSNIAAGEKAYIDFPAGLNPGYYVVSIFDGEEMIESAQVIIN